MEQHTHPSARAVFDHALEIQSPAERQAYLTQACGGDPSLRRQVDALLRAYDMAGSFLEAPPTGLGSMTISTHPLAHPLREAPGTVVGPYKLLEQIGEGGMGVVFLAEQTRPVRRRVALKVVKAGMDTRQVVARFEAERQALAMMDHPNIAKVLDAGATDSGRPYFVMELVRGVPITQYCDRNRVGTRQRLELFVQVCYAVQHAHQKGIIHRDLKPSNVMITTHDGVPVPRIIDFGVAKAVGPGRGIGGGADAPAHATAHAGPDADGDGGAGEVGQRLTERTLFTEYRQLVGTPQYMSPEQADASSGLDADTRTDVYALGVLLYELLTGTTPLDAAALRTAGLDEMRRLIRETPPPRPSSRVTTAAGAEVVEARRLTDARALGRLLRGELDWVVMKCLEKDRNRRYETSSALARDVTRYLNDEPVHARTASGAYRARKFIRRHRRPVAAAAAVLLALVLGIVGTTQGMLRARAARAEALADRNAARHAQLQAEANAADARREAARASSVSGFIGGLLAMSHPEGRIGDGDAAAAMLVRMASQLITERLAGQPEEELRARVVLADSCRRLGFHDQTVSQLEVAHRLSREMPGGARSERTLGLACDIAMAMHLAGHDDRAEPLARSTLQAARDALGERHPLTWRTTDTLALSVGGPKSPGGGEEGRQLWADLLERLRDVPEARRAEYEGRYCLNLGRWFQQRDRHDEALAALRRAAAAGRSGPASAATERGLLAEELVYPLAVAGAWEDARDLALAALREDAPGLGELHWATRSLLYWAARMLSETGRPEEALPLYRRCIDVSLKVYPRGIPQVPVAMDEYGLLLLRRGDRAGAAELFSRAVAMRTAMQGRHDWLDHERARAWAMCAAPALHGTWRSASVRNHVWCALDDLLRDHPPAKPDPAEVPLARLRFTLQKWPAAPGEGAAAGGLDELKALAEPEPGLYLLGLEVPRAAAHADPLRRAAWLLVARWDVGVHPMRLFDTGEARWRGLLSRGPAQRATRPALALPGELDPLTAVDRPSWYGVVATATVQLPPGRYRFSLTSDDGARLSVNGRPAIDAWSEHHSRTDDAELELAAGSHELRVENYQGNGPHRLWLQVAPRTLAARAATAALGGGVPGLEWQAESAGRDVLEKPADTRSTARRAELLARAGRFEESAEACAVAARLVPSDARVQCLRALLLAPSADEAGYRETCDAMLRQFGTSPDAGVREQLVLAHSARPGPAGAGARAEYERRLEQLLESAPAAGPHDDHPSSVALAQGIAQYRLGRYDAAAQTLRRFLSVVPEDAPAARAAAEWFVAMCCHQLGQPPDARAAAARAAGLTESRLPTRFVDDLDHAPGGLFHWLLCQAAGREARAMLDPPPSPPR